MKHYISNWLSEYRCFSCEQPMSYSTKMGSRGRCPHCGEKHEDACTIVECTEHAYRLYTESQSPKWWQVWIPKPDVKREYK